MLEFDDICLDELVVVEIVDDIADDISIDLDDSSVLFITFSIFVLR